VVSDAGDSVLDECLHHATITWTSTKPSLLMLLPTVDDHTLVRRNCPSAGSQSRVTVSSTRLNGS
jgi:hypothetical protein